MGLSGLEIYKLLPKTNCRQCGFPTCLAFAMQLAKKAVPLDRCPFLTEDIKRMLEESSLPPIRLITIGRDDYKLEIGNETVLFRHEEKFYHPTGIGMVIDDDLAEDKILEIVQDIKTLEFERVGQRLKIELIAIRNRSGLQNFLKVLDLVVKNISLAVVLMCEDPNIIKKALERYRELNPLIYRITSKNLSEISPLIKQYSVPAVVWGKDLEEISSLVKELNKNGVNDLVLEIEDENSPQPIWDLTQIRRLSLKKRERSLGYPVLLVVKQDDPSLAVIRAASYIAKYAGIVLLEGFRREDVLGILTLRQNIYADPQKPLQIEPKLYPVGNANQNSFVLVTTNFSLTYYTVLGEVEASKIPSYILSVNTEGMSVLTAWAAEKFTPDSITEAVNKANLIDIVSHRRLIIPGYVAVMSGELEEKSGWQVIVGPKEASGIPTFLKNL